MSKVVFRVRASLPVQNEKAVTLRVAAFLFYIRNKIGTLYFYY